MNSFENPNQVPPPLPEKKKENGGLGKWFGLNRKLLGMIGNMVAPEIVRAGKDKLEKHIQSKEKGYAKKERRETMENEIRTLDTGECLSVGAILNSQIHVPYGAKFVAGIASNTRIEKELGGQVDVMTMEDGSQIVEVEVKRENCPNCGAPWSGSKCAHCGTVR